MTGVQQRGMRIMSLYPTHRGVAFAVLEEGFGLVDWGIARLYSKKDEEVLVRVEALIARYSPKVVALEDVSGTRRGETAARRINSIIGIARLLEIHPILISRGEIRFVLGLSPSAPKYEMAKTIAERFPEMREFLPARRKSWEAESEKMSVFDAVALCLGNAHCPLNFYPGTPKLD